jgi:hypothetical protein
MSRTTLSGALVVALTSFSACSSNEPAREAPATRGRESSSDVSPTGATVASALTPAAYGEQKQSSEGRADSSVLLSEMVPLPEGTDSCDGNWLYAPPNYRENKWSGRMPFSIRIQGRTGEISYSDYGRENVQVKPPTTATDEAGPPAESYSVESEGLDGFVSLQCKGDRALMQFLHSGPEEYIDLVRSKGEVTAVLLARGQMSADGEE